ncbi:hypothetical protein L2E82_06042 [Cichorium intybus]|uniref:Uncharacterized protein n=1 Tax=Cichorium intybus TaxID=13427 RepID=A0ACB9H9H6_CICIN|nr:hypothetical protein L2E82_06042 [Cichorium intybus]
MWVEATHMEVEKSVVEPDGEIFIIGSASLLALVRHSGGDNESMGSVSLVQLPLEVELGWLPEELVCGERWAAPMNSFRAILNANGEHDLGLGSVTVA